MPRCLLAAPAHLDPLAHARPFVEPGLVIADMVLGGAPDAVHFIDLDAGPGSGAETNKQPHGPAVIVRKIKESRIVVAAAHGDPFLGGLGLWPRLHTALSPKRVP